MASHADNDVPSGAVEPPLASAVGSDNRDVISLREATKTWFAISCQTFGGPAGQIAVMQRTLAIGK